jgi:hypothetical protein
MVREFRWIDKESGRAPIILSKSYSDGYEHGLEEGIAKTRAEVEVMVASEILLRLGRKKWGEPHERVLSRVEAIDDFDRLALLLDRLLDASSWDELFPPAESSV